MKAFIKILILILSINFMFHCSERKRLNPIDPHNSETGGRLQGLEVYSEFDRAVLHWQQLPIKNIQGYQIYRKQDSDLNFTAITATSPDSNEYIDYGLDYNKKYHYFVTVLGEDFETPASDTVSIVPGPIIIWVTDVYNRRILKISNDGSHEITQIPVDGYPWALAYDSENSTLWYTDVFLNRVYRMQSQDFEVPLNETYGAPIDMVLDKNNDQVWIVDETQGKISVFNRQGVKLGGRSGFENPISIDCDLNDGSCWVADSKARTVTKISASLEMTLQIKDLINPTSVSVNQTTQDCWVADSTRILKFDLKGGSRLTIESQGDFLRYLAVDSETGNCWVLDFSFFADQSRLICFNNNGEKLFELSGFTYPENLKIDPYDNSCVVTDSGAGRILKIGLDGSIIGQVSGYDYTRGLFIEMQE